MYRRSGFLILVALCILRVNWIHASLGTVPVSIYCQQCHQQNRGCVQQSCTPTCLPGHIEDGEGNCVESQDPGWGDVSSQDNQIDRVALQAHQQARSQNELNDPQVSDFSDVDTQTGERWQKPILKDTGHSNPDSAVLAGGDIDASLDGTADRGKGNYRIDPRVMTVEHHDGDNQDEKVSDVLRVADDIEPAPHPPVPQAMRADAEVSNPLEQAATMADVYFLHNNDINLAASEPVAMNLAAASETLNSADPETGFVTGFTFYVIVAGCSVAGMVGLVVAGVCWYRLQKNVKAASEAEYPAYGVTGPTKERTPSPGDRKLAQSAQMYHYQHQKQQMLALEKANNEMNQEASDDDSDEENDEGNYTVYECPGLATTGEMEVKNPMFEETPVNPPHTESGQEATEK